MPLLSRSIPFLSLALLLASAGHASATDRVRLQVGSIEGADWRADAVSVEAGTDGGLRLEVGRIDAAALPGPASLHLDCPAKRAAPAPLRCRDGSLRLQWPQWGELRARVDLEGDTAGHGLAHLRALRGPGLELRELRLVRDARGIRLTLDLVDADLAVLTPVARPWLPPLAYTVAGHASGQASAVLAASGDIEARTDLRLEALDFADEEGRHAGEGLGLRLDAGATRRAGVIDVGGRLAIEAGQAYVEPVFVDFGEHPAHLAVEGELRDGMATVPSLVLDQRDLVRLSGQGRLPWPMAEGRPTGDMRLQVQEAMLAPLLSFYVQPFLAGSRFDPLQGGGRISGSLSMEAGAPAEAALVLDEVSVEIPKLVLGMAGLNGELRWRDGGMPVDSSLRWAEGHLGRLPLGGSELRFRAHHRGLVLLAPLRQPVLDGALVVKRLTLQGIGTDDLSAEFGAEVESIDLALLTEALDWPRFSGHIGGRLPSLRLQDDTVELEGELSAQAFDGEITLGNLRIIEPFGVVPRIMADLRLRRLDLEAVTGAFSFGSITGRLDGDIIGLRLLGGEPVAFDAHLYSTPGDRSRRRISQRAIDNISAAGGGPSGLLSTGALRVFSDFPYRRIGWSCRLHDNVCRMDGIEPGPDGGYVLVQGRWLPRINVIGYGHRVDWSTFINQLTSVIKDQQSH